MNKPFFLSGGNTMCCVTGFGYLKLKHLRDRQLYNFNTFATQDAAWSLI